MATITDALRRVRVNEILNSIRMNDYTYDELLEMWKAIKDKTLVVKIVDGKMYAVETPNKIQEVRDGSPINS